MEFDPFSRDFFEDPYETYRWLRDEEPCYHSERYGFWALSRFDDVVAAHLDHRSFSSTQGLTYDQLIDPDFDGSYQLITMDPPEHDRFRTLVNRAFTPRSVLRYEELVRRVITRHLDRLADREEFDFVEDFAAPFPVEIICSILGVPEEDHQQLRLWTDQLLHRDEGRAAPPSEALEAGVAQGAYLYELISRKRRQPGDDMLSDLIAAEVATADGGSTELTDVELAGFGVLLAAAGSETVTKLLGNAAVLFHRHPDQWAAVVDQPSRLPGAVEEVVRYWAPSQYQGRFSTRPTTWHGVTLPEGVPVFLITGAASRDERAYPDPDRFDIDRPPSLSVGFGHGVHVCLGAALARLESRIALEEVGRRWPRFEVDEDGLSHVQMSNVAGFANVPVRVRT